MDVDVRAAWWLGGAEFTAWYTASVFVGSAIFVGLRKHLRRVPMLIASASMSILSWLLVSVLKVPLVACVVIHEFILAGRNDPLSWMIGLPTAAMLSGIAATLVLRGFRLSISRVDFATLFALYLMCATVATYRMAAYMAMHPPEA